MFFKHLCGFQGDETDPVLISEKVKEIPCEYILSAREQILQEIIIT